MTNADVGRRLVELGAGDVAHPGGTLLRHLQGAHDALQQLDAPEPHRLAALCHAVYGTDGFDRSLCDPSERQVFASLIGSEAEELVFLYSISNQAEFTRSASDDHRFVLDRRTQDRLALSHEQLAGLLAVWLGNELDTLRHADPAWALAGGSDVWDMLERNERLIPAGGVDALRDAVSDARSAAR